MITYDDERPEGTSSHWHKVKLWPGSAVTGRSKLTKVNSPCVIAKFR